MEEVNPMLHARARCRHLSIMTLITGASAKIVIVHSEEAFATTSGEVQRLGGRGVSLLDLCVCRGEASAGAAAVAVDVPRQVMGQEH